MYDGGSVWKFVACCFRDSWNGLTCRAAKNVVGWNVRGESQEVKCLFKVLLDVNVVRVVIRRTILFPMQT